VFRLWFLFIASSALYVTYYQEKTPHFEQRP